MQAISKDLCRAFSMKCYDCYETTVHCAGAICRNCRRWLCCFLLHSPTSGRSPLSSSRRDGCDQSGFSHPPGPQTLAARRCPEEATGVRSDIHCLYRCEINMTRHAAGCPLTVAVTWPTVSKPPCPAVLMLSVLISALPCAGTDIKFFNN